MSGVLTLAEAAAIYCIIGDVNGNYPTIDEAVAYMNGKVSKKEKEKEIKKNYQLNFL